MGEVMGVGDIFGEVFGKVLLGVGEKIFDFGIVFISVCESDKFVVLEVVKQLIKLGFKLFVISGIVKMCWEVGLLVKFINKVKEGCFYIVDVIKNWEVELIINMMEGIQVVVDFFVIWRQVLLGKICYIIMIVGVQVICVVLEINVEFIV